MLESEFCLDFVLVRLSFYGRHNTRADKNFHSYETLNLFIAQNISEYDMTMIN